MTDAAVGEAVTFPIVSTPQIQQIESPSANPAADSTTSDTSGNTLLPLGTVYTPRVSYPMNRVK
jgi:hypothetical protein